MTILAALLAATLSGPPPTFYVATGGSNGDTGGSGDPWATIDHALANVPDGALILVRAGMYEGRVRLDEQFASGVTVRSEMPYMAQLRYDQGAALICYTCQNVTVEGFDIAHTGDNTGALVIQIQDLLGSVAGSDGGTDAVVSGVTLRNNIIHDSTNNDLLKVNNGAEDVLIEGNMFFNQSGSDEHIDVNSVRNVTVRGNIFFNTTPQTSTSSYVVIKDSNADDDTVLGSQNITVDRNIFLNWQGSSGQSFVRVGEDGTANYEAIGVLVENNLFIGNSDTRMRAAFTVMGSSDVTFRNNTVTGDLSSLSYAARLFAFGSNQPNDNIRLYNNIWSDPTGTMGTEQNAGADVFEAPASENQTLELSHNLYFNGGNAIPTDAGQALNLADDSFASIGDPALPDPSTVTIPVWNGMTFADGSSSILEVFTTLAMFAQPGNSLGVDTADPFNAPAFDLLGRRRVDLAPDRGALEEPDPEFLFIDGFETL